MRVTLDRSKNASAPYLKGTFFWHIDGCTPAGDECPQMATVLSAKAVAETGGETEFASTYAAYDDLTDEEKDRLVGMRVVHSLEASQRLAFPDPNEKLVDAWRMRKTSEHPLVWTHRDGRRSLVLGASTDHVVGMDLEEGRALLADLLDRSTSARAHLPPPVDGRRHRDLGQPGRPPPRRRRTTPTHRVRCSGRRCWATSRSSDGSCRYVVERMSLEGEYEPSPWKWVSDQVDAYERSGGGEANTLLDTGLPVIIVTTRGESPASAQDPSDASRARRRYPLVGSLGGAPKHPVWDHNLKANPDQ